MTADNFEYKDNFQVITPRTMVDPKLKILVSMGRMHWDGEGVQVIRISHDPGLDPNNLTKISSTRLDFVKDNDGNPKVVESIVPATSNKLFSFFEFYLEKTTEDQALILTFQGADEQFSRANLGSVQRNNLYKCSDRKAFLRYVFRNVLLLPDLQHWGLGKCTKVELRMTAVQLAVLEDRPVEGLSGDIIFDERDLEVAP